MDVRIGSMVYAARHAALSSGHGKAATTASTKHGTLTAVAKVSADRRIDIHGELVVFIAWFLNGERLPVDKLLGFFGR